MWVTVVALATLAFLRVADLDESLPSTQTESVPARLAA